MFSASSLYHKPDSTTRSSPRKQTSGLKPARGMMIGAALSSAIWVAIASVIFS